jgi:hypothetical protein
MSTNLCGPAPRPSIHIKLRCACYAATEIRVPRTLDTPGHIVIPDWLNIPDGWTLNNNEPRCPACSRDW